MGSDDIFDILLLIFVLALFSPIMLTNSLPLFRGEVGGFDTLIEKTAKKSDEEITPVENALTRDDLLLMVTIADPSTKQPEILQLSIDKNNDGVIGYDETSDEITIDELINQKAKVLSIINAYIDSKYDKLELCTLVGPNGIEKWVVFKK